MMLFCYRVPLTNGGTAAFPKFELDEQKYVAINNNWTTWNYHKYPRIQFWNRFTVSLLNTSFGSCNDHVTQCPATDVTLVNGVRRLGPSVVVSLIMMIVAREVV